MNPYYHLQTIRSWHPQPAKDSNPPSKISCPAALPHKTKLVINSQGRDIKVTQSLRQVADLPLALHVQAYSIAEKLHRLYLTQVMKMSTGLSTGHALTGVLATKQWHWSRCPLKAMMRSAISCIKASVYFITTCSISSYDTISHNSQHNKVLLLGSTDLASCPYSGHSLLSPRQHLLDLETQQHHRTFLSDPINTRQ